MSGTNNCDKQKDEQQQQTPVAAKRRSEAGSRKNQPKRGAPKKLPARVIEQLEPVLDLDKILKSGFSRELFLSMTEKEIKAVPSYVYHKCLEKFPDDPNKASESAASLMKKFNLIQKRELKNQKMFAMLLG